MKVFSFNPIKTFFKDYYNTKLSSEKIILISKSPFISIQTKSMVQLLTPNDNCQLISAYHHNGCNIILKVDFLLIAKFPPLLIATNAHFFPIQYNFVIALIRLKGILKSFRCYDSQATQCNRLSIRNLIRSN